MVKSSEEDEEVILAFFALEALDMILRENTKK
jgi:hypothetical protein